MKKEDSIHKRNKKSTVRADIVLIAALLLAALSAYILITCFAKKEGSNAVVKVDGEVQCILNIKDDTQMTVTGYQGGNNIIVVKAGVVYMSDADCPDKLCVHMGKISKTGETIVCLPHRVVVEIVGAQDGYDSVVQ